MEGVVHGVGAGLPTQIGTDSCSCLTPRDPLWKHGNVGTTKLIIQDRTVTKTPSPNHQHQIQRPLINSKYV